MPDYDKNGFKKGPSGSGVFPDLNYKSTDVRDFESWDYMQIRAVINGSAGAPAKDVPQGRLPFADPESIRQAGVVFNRARTALEYVSENVRLQTEALAGENGAWKGPAADAFRSMNLLFAAKLKAKAIQINGGEFAGVNNVPDQLWTSGNFLQWAQESISWLDSEYANWILSLNHKMGDNLADIKKVPGAADLLSEAMKKVMRILADRYVYNTDAVIPPNPGDFKTPSPLPGGTDGPGGLGNLGGLGNRGGPNLPGTGALNAALQSPATPSDGPPSVGGGNPPTVNLGPPPAGGAGGKPPSLNVGPPPGARGAGGAELPKPPSLDLPPLPGLSGGSGGGSAPKPPALDIPAPPGGAELPKPPSLDLPPLPGLSGGSGGGSAPKPPALNLPAPPKGGGGGAALPKPPSLSVDSPAGSGSGSGSGTALPKPPSLTVAGPPTAGTGTGLGGAAMPPGAPMMPPGGMGGQPGGSGAERPDSAGLLGGVKDPWDAAALPSIGDPVGTGPGAVKPEDWAAGVQSGSSGGAGTMSPPGAPMMPPGGMGGQPGGSGTERPDSAGLLGGEQEPWEGASLPAIDLDQASPLSAIEPEKWAVADGGVSPQIAGEASTGGLSEPSGHAVTSAGTPSMSQAGQQVPGAGMPPMMPPSAGGQPAAAEERPDSSALLGGLNEPWAAQAGPEGVGGAPDAASPAASPEKWAVQSEYPTPWPVMPVPAATPPAANPNGTDRSATASSKAVTPGEKVGAEPQAAAAVVDQSDVAASDVAIDLSPPVARAGLVMSADVVSPTRDLAPEEFDTARPTPVTGQASEFPRVDGDGNVSDDGDEERAAGGFALQGGGADTTPPADSVAVVLPDDAERDTSAWDIGALNFLMPSTAMPLFSPSPGKSGRETKEDVTDVSSSLAEQAEPESGVALTTYRRRKTGEGSTVIDSYVAPPSCGSTDALSEEDQELYLAEEAEQEKQRERDDEEAEEQERSAADLLNAGDSAWGAEKAPRSVGVLE